MLRSLHSFTGIFSSSRPLLDRRTWCLSCILQTVSYHWYLHACQFWVCRANLQGHTPKAFLMRPQTLLQVIYRIKSHKTWYRPSTVLQERCFFLSAFLPPWGTSLLATSPWVLPHGNPSVNNDSHTHHLWSGKESCHPLMIYKPARRKLLCTIQMTRVSIWPICLPTWNIT